MQGLKTATTNQKGFFRCPAFPQGTCEVACQKDGYSAAMFDMVRISLGFTGTANAQLTAQGKDTQLVTDRGPTVDRTSTQTSGSCSTSTTCSTTTRMRP